MDKLHPAIDETWFTSQYQAIDDAANARRPSFTTIDLTAFRFATLLDLVELYLLVDRFQDSVSPVTIQFHGCGPHFPDFIKIDDFNRLRRRAAKDGSVRNSSTYQEANSIYRFLSFLHHYGFFDALRFHQTLQRVTCSGIGESFLEQLYSYSGIRNIGTVVLGLRPIRDISDTDAFRSQNEIDRWIENLPDQFRAMPLFSDGEFSRVFGYHLIDNIVQHAAVTRRSEIRVLGAIAMRIIPNDNQWWIRQSVPEPMQGVLTGDGGSILEIVVGDSGCGIAHSLRNAYEKFHSRHGLEATGRVDDILSFAFDELGSSKTYSQPDKSNGDVHALHRILRCVAKYRGCLRLRSSRREIFYNLTEERFLTRGSNRIGLLPTETSHARDTFTRGTTIQILLPIVSPKRSACRITPRKAERPSPTAEITLHPHIVAVASYISDSPDRARRLDILRESLIQEPEDRTILFDFFRCDWSEEEFHAFLVSQKSVLHTRQCVAARVPASLAQAVRQREVITRESPRREGLPHVSFLEVLTDEHRLLPIIDTASQFLWLGLGTYKLDAALNASISIDGSFTVDDLCTLDAGTSGSIRNEILLYLAANPHFFKPSGTDGRWQCILTRESLLGLQRHLLCHDLPNCFDNLSVIWKGDAFRLPASDGFAREFVHSTRLLQSDSVSHQLGAWLYWALRELIGNGPSEVLLVTATSPGAMLCRLIQASSPDLLCHTLDLGNYFTFDEAAALREGNWSMPAVLVTDVMDTGQTLKRMLALLHKNQFDVQGALALIRLRERSSRRTDAEALYFYREQILDHNLQCFVVFDWDKPEHISDDSQELKQPDFTAYFVEPYSLEPFKYALLEPKPISAKNPEHAASAERKEIINTRRLLVMDQESVIRTGHWVYGEHHFSIITATRKLLHNDTIASPLAGMLAKYCHDNDIHHILLPGQSHIAEFVPRLQATLKVSYGIHIEATQCVSTQTLSDTPFYVIPHTLEQQLLTAESSRTLNVLILDDSAATGRTGETIVRALLRAARRALGSGRRTTSPLSSIHMYVIVDRLGRAKGTFWTGVRSLSLDSDGDAIQEISDSPPVQERLINFRYSRWLDLEVPVYDKDSCPLCSEISELKSLISDAHLPPDHTVCKRIESRLDEITDRPIDTPHFDSQVRTALGTNLQIGRFDAIDSLELALLEFCTQIHQGATLASLLSEIEECQNNRGNGATATIDKLVEEMMRQLLRRWKRFRSQAAASGIVQRMGSCVAQSGNALPWILAETGRAVAKHGLDDSVLSRIMNTALHDAAHLTSTDDPADERRELLHEGIVMSILSIHHSAAKDHAINVVGTLQGKVERLLSECPSPASATYLQDILQVARKTTIPDAFIPAFITVSEHTLRAARHNHSHLIPFALREISGAKQLTAARIRAQINALSEFSHCMNIVASRSPATFGTPDARQILPLFLDKIRKLIESLTTLGSEIDDKTKRLARDLQNMYPVQRVNSLFRCILDTHLRLSVIARHVSERCRQSDITVDVIDDTGGAENLAVIVPNEMDVLDLFTNVTSEAQPRCEIGTSRCVTLRFRSENADHGFRQIHIEAFTNWTSPEESKRRLESGQMIVETRKRAFELFGVKTQLDYDVVGPNGASFAAVLKVTLCQGFGIQQKEGN